MDLFGRYFGDLFTYEEVEQIIEKRLREDAYDKLIEDVYVSSKTGNDSNDGLTSESAFASLFAINQRSLQPGDHVLLERGSIFCGQYLQVTDSGREDAPIVIGAYGEGDAPRIEACGQGIWYQNYGAPLDSPTHVYRGYVSSAVLLYDAEYIIVEDLEITNEADKLSASTIPLETR